MPNSQEVLIIGKVWPEPSSSAAGARMMQLLKLFKAKNCSITFATAAGESEYAADLINIGVKSQKIKLNDTSFDEFIKELKPGMVIFDRFMTEEQFGWRVAEHAPDAMRILDTEDLHGLRAARQIAVKEGRPMSDYDLVNDYSIREVASILRCDCSLIISSFEMKLLQTTYQVDRSLVYYLPFLFDPVTDSESEKWIPFHQRKHFISIGNFLHEPNWDAVLNLKNTICPLIHTKLPEAELHVYGAYPSQKVFQLHDPDTGFHVKGRAEDAKEVISQSRVMLAPLRFGAGLKGKLADAMRFGTPSITTSIGAEGMNGDADWPGYIYDEPQNFAQSAIDLYRDEELWHSKQNKGKAILNHLFNGKLLSEELWFKLSNLKENLVAHRERNFLGRMMMHHSLNSSRYMGKWIEEKEKNKASV